MTDATDPQCTCPDGPPPYSHGPVSHEPSCAIHRKWKEERDAARLAVMTADQREARDRVVRAIGQRAHALMRHDGEDPAIVAASLLWCAASMYAQGAPDLERVAFLGVVGQTWDEVKEFLAEIAAKAAAEKKPENPEGGTP